MHVHIIGLFSNCLWLAYFLSYFTYIIVLGSQAALCVLHDLYSYF
jgi:hypothetical protein